MRKSKKNYVIVALVVILIALAIGYASFQSVLTITGNATGSVSWDVKFTEAKLLQSDGTTTDTTHGKIKSITDTAIVADIDLSYQGDGVILQATVLNNSTIPAKLTSFTVTGADTDLLVTYDNPTGEVLDAGKSCTVQLFVKWAATSTVNEITKTITVNYTYDQNVTEVNATPSHTNT